MKRQFHRITLAALLTAALIFTVVSFISCGDKSEGGAASDTIKIGSVHPLSGGMAYEGQAIVNAQQLAVDEINAAGGIGGRLLELVSADSAGNASTAATQAQRLASQGVVALTGCYTSSSTQTVSLEAERASVPLVVTIAAAPDLLTRGYKYSFRVQPSTDVFCENFLEYYETVSSDDLKTVVFVYEDSNYGSAIADYLSQRVGELGLTVLDRISYSASAATLASEVTRLAALAPDVLIPIGYYSDQSLLTGEILSRGLTFKRVIGVANGAFCDPKFLAEYGDKVEGYIDVNYRYNPKSDLAVSVLASYKEKYGADMPLHAIYGYESIKVIADALSRAAEITPAALRDALAATSLADHTLPQGAIEFNETGEDKNAAGVMIQIQSGKHVVIAPAQYAEGEYIPPVR